MSVGLQDKLIALLSEADSLKAQETTIKTDKTRHLESIATAETEVTNCNNALDDIRKSQMRLKKEMDSIRDDLFHREDEETITIDDSHIPTDGSAQLTESEGKRSWRERQKSLRQVQ